MLPIPGTSSIEHLEQNVAAASLWLSDEEYGALSDASERRIPAAPSAAQPSVAPD